MSLRIATLLALAASATAFTAPAANGASSALAANIMDTAAALEGVAVVWGADGIAVGKEESDFKEFNGFGKFLAAANAAGLGAELAGPGPYTLFLPADYAMNAYTGALTPEVIKYHIAAGKITSGSIGADIPTLNGQALKYERKFRKTFLNDAIVGQQEFGGAGYPTDVEADNGIIHAISVVLEPN
eukprot:CAMPEP_0119013064 /NCGR_PEP_ID=MMETSP1176-20130426/7828_1 /TAXON_ID=265551 /ORGANISM="Synedropsis recta cf, Strain CCMP1620" /LENGTH=185 /DNA_ID=CAMNT_0006966115 /DNA_START=73 /DNA_END=630 /DNA_ORIENTATION=+